jgi:hypothetical protein
MIEKIDLLPILQAVEKSDMGFSDNKIPIPYEGNEVDLRNAARVWGEGHKLCGGCGIEQDDSNSRA